MVAVTCVVRGGGGGGMIQLQYPVPMTVEHVRTTSWPRGKEMKAMEDDRNTGRASLPRQVLTTRSVVVLYMCWLKPHPHPHPCCLAALSHVTMLNCIKQPFTGREGRKHRAIVQYYTLLHLRGTKVHKWGIL